MVPRKEEVQYKNMGKLIETSVLFVDIRGSTDLTDSHNRSTVAKIYKCFINEMVRAARYKKGRIRNFAGDRIMVIFNRITDGSEDPANRAVETAIIMQSLVKHILNKKLAGTYNREIGCGIGIAFGKMLATRVGIQGEISHNDLVWAGDSANIASKLADISDPGEIVITEEIYHRLNESNKQPGWWEETSVPIGGKKITVYYNSGLFFKTTLKDAGYHD